MAPELCFLKAVVLNSHGPDMSVILHLPWNCSGACAFSVLPEDILSNILAYQSGSGTFSCCSSVLQMHTHVCLTCDTYHWLDQVNGTLLMKAMKISSVVSWF